MVLAKAAIVDGTSGLLRTQPDGSVLWEAELDGSAVAALVRRALIHGGLACWVDSEQVDGEQVESRQVDGEQVAGEQATLRVQCLYYDAGRRRLVAELVGVPTAVS